MHNRKAREEGAADATNCLGGNWIMPGPGFSSLPHPTVDHEF